jgi:NadR type nicotinamide-nucleotide adenylyltransferase
MNSTLIRIAVVGPESSGKSTLCAALADALQTQWVPEYARSYLEAHQKINVDSQEELQVIAAGQLAAEEAIASGARQHLICDTDLHMVRIWSETMYNQCSHRILASIATRQYDLYLLSFPDVPWQADPLRGYPDYKDRHYFYLQYLDMVINSGLPFAVIRGTEEERLNAALTAIKQLSKS